MNKLNIDVSQFLDTLNHPLRAEIEALRTIILKACNELTENIKWNGPNYAFDGEDRITMKIQPPKQIQLIFHRGAKKLEQPKTPLIKDSSGLLSWKENDRAVASFKSVDDIKNNEPAINEIVLAWLAATKNV
ncbi:DUF1801 domain-containing protein [Marinoscillum pacificum]|uniref:DUF1801 domain-containing protein n=1 Tax=Marinoscillum pacificum TaxID=392723 RepID=UPI00215780BC|nr:DUF1801 domain-containing protein [Marinoscillum pacificum]